MMVGLGGVLFYRMADGEDMKEGERLENGWVVRSRGTGKGNLRNQRHVEGIEALAASSECALPTKMKRNGWMEN